MKPTQDKYPVFEANQVLTNAHLNQQFNYLDEQERLTRANLIGIGIVCGLDIRLDNVTTPTTIHLSKGCGISSEGYLIVGPEDVALVSYRADYKAPDELDYRPFKDPTSREQYSLWELFPAGEPNTTPLNAVPNFLNDKAVVLFLELKKEGLRNCSPNNCDDKGAEVMATVRRLLIKVDDLTKIIAAANQLGAGLTFTDLETALLARLNLPDLHLPRYDVPNTSTVTSNQVLAAFHAVFHTDRLAHNTGKALIAAYEAFKPLVQDAYLANPFADFNTNFGFLDNTPTTTTQVRFLQYYYDFFDDLLRAYDEFRWKGVELMCACCPPEGLFPHHLMLGTLFPASVNNPGIYRHHFLASSVIGGCEERTKELIQLFRRMVEMITRFTNTPTLPQSALISRMDTQIRITPSKLGDVPLSDKAIPYYYLQNGTPQLFQLWNAGKTRRNRANQNLSYRSGEYTPPAPKFVTDTLRYDLEPYNFLRIEGQLGKNYQSVLNTLLSLKTRYRLPIEIIALRTGAFDESIPVNLSKEDCRFQDLETLYDTLKAELSCFLCKEIQYFYNLPYRFSSGITIPVKPKLPLLVQCAPDFLVQPQTLGRLFEDWLSNLPGGVIPDIDPNIIINFLNSQNAGQSISIIFYIIIYISKLFDQLSQDLGQLNFVNFEKRYRDLVSVTEAIEREREQATGNIEGNTNLLNWEELDDRLEAIIYNCRLDTFRALQEEYKRRIREVKQKQFLSYFLRNNPGIQHKAGVPFGGTFIIVYHDEPARLTPGLNLDEIRAITLSTRQTFDTAKINTVAVADAFTRISSNRQLALDPDIRFLLGTFTGQAPDFSIAVPPSEGAEKIIKETVDELADGIVIADFYLPYLCCSDCSPLQFVLPKTPPTFTVQIGCTNPNNQAEVTVTPEGGLAPYIYQLDAQPFQALIGKLVLTAGSHTLVIRDSAGTESAPQSLTVPGLLTIGTETFIDDVPAKTYQVSFTISGGTSPYQAESGTVENSTYTSKPIQSAESIQAEITDSIGCKVSKEFEHTVCNLPCEGQSRRCAYRLWLQPPIEDAPYENYTHESSILFRFNDKSFTLTGTFVSLQIPRNVLNTDFQNAMGDVIKKLNDVINQTLVNALGQSGNNRLVITYVPAEIDPFGILLIEHFVCDTFNIEFDYSYAKPAPAFSLTIRYTNVPNVTGAPFNGIILINRRIDNKETRVPAFDCIERNQCSGIDYKKLCEGSDPIPSFTSSSSGNNQFQFKGGVEIIPASEIVAWVWDVFIAQPTEPFYQGQTVQAQLLKPGGPVRLTAITQKGCFSTVQKNINQ